MIFVQAADLDLEGTEIERIDTDETIKAHLERIRCAVAVEIGIAETIEEATQRSQAVPKIAWVSTPKSYQTLGGKAVDVAEADTDEVPDSGPTVASRTCMIIGKILQARGDGQVLGDLEAVEGLDRDLLVQ